ncbi:KPN_02809 family neutral zinc metallopeptidase [Leeia oryzae]|uniref:KPN_02809 family neutral zinc metallopeptidase n=1 Tax=Leeia oryzae TaxID=356662 RepID=UPI00037E752F|nr:neutral zinc metallopeptidase [Leeia oryzae]
MKWDEMRRSDEVEDRRDERGGFGLGGGGGFSGFGGFRLSGTAIIIVIVVSVLLGKNPLVILSYLQGGSPVQVTQHAAPTQAKAPPVEDQTAQMVRAVLGDTEDVWGKLFAEAGKTYTRPRLVLFRGAVQSACGRATSAVGPFYCSGDQKVFIDLEFFDELHQRFGAPGDFAQAYVIAHEVGHHVQNLIGVTQQVAEKGDGASEKVRNALSVRQELQADCFAGVWGHSAQSRNLLEAGDLDEALRAANAIGDDRLQQEAQGHVSPDSFTHGTSAQRIHWFKVGFESGQISQCNTFKVAHL